MRAVSIFLIFIMSFYTIAEPILSAKAIAQAMSFDDAVSEGKTFGQGTSGLYHPDAIDATLRQQCLEKDEQGNCTKYLVDDTSGKGRLIPDASKIKDNFATYGSQSAAGVPSMQAQGAATGEYSEFLLGVSQNKCIDYVPCKTSCRDFPNAYCDGPSNYISGLPPSGSTSTLLGNSYENFRHTTIDDNKNFECQYEVYEWNKVSANGVDVYYKRFIRLEREQKVCNSSNLSDDTIFGNKCLQYDLQGKCTKWSASRDIMENTYADCTKVKTPIYDTPGTLEKCIVPATSINITTDQPPCSIQNTAEITYTHSDTECDTVGTVEPDQIYSTCKNNWLWYKTFDRVVNISSPCPTQCSDIGGYCNPPAGIAGPPQGATYLGIQHINFSRTPVSDGVQCSHYDFSWWFKDNIYYYNDEGTHENFIPCPTTCLQVGGLCENQPTNNVFLSPPPSGATYLGESSEDFFGCTYKVYKWYRKLNYAEIERVKLIRSSNCDSSELDRMTRHCWTKEYSICQPGGGGCVTVVHDGSKVAVNKVCKTENGTLHNYTICPNDGGSLVVESDQYDIVGMTIDDQEGLKSVERNLVNESMSGFANSLMWVKAWGGLTVRPFLNDWNANVIYSCESYPKTPPECEEYVSQGCIYKEFKCINPPQENPSPIVAPCNTYEYTYQCGAPESKVIGYETSYVCSNSVIPGLRCMGTDCGADTEYQSNQDFIAFATGLEIMKQIQIDSDKIDPNNIRIFPGERMECMSWPNNCCQSLSGAMGIAAYVQLGFQLAKAYQMVNAGWSGIMATNVSILGNYAGFLGMTALEVSATSEMSVALLMPEAGGLQFVGIGKDLGEVYTVVMADASTVTVGTIMSAISIALLVYSIISIVYQLLFSCSQEDVKTGIQVGQARCVHVDTYCARRILGICIKRKKAYCCFNSLLARLVHEQGRPQIGKGWGNCEGFTPEEMSMLDFSRMDLSEYMQYLEGKYREEFNNDEQENIENSAMGRVSNRQAVITARLNEYFNSSGTGRGGNGGSTGPTCVLNISPLQDVFVFGGGDGIVAVTSSTPSCAWTASSNVPWITITSGSSGTGEGNVYYAVSLNPTNAERVGTLTIADKTFMIRQLGCTVSISPISKSFSSFGGDGIVAVTSSTPSCAWTASSNVPWITITSGGSGSGNGSVSYSVSTNTGSQRTGTITINGFTHTVTQAGI